jgi:hypothetical protein
MIIIQDTREKNGWNFDIYEECHAVEKQGLKEGDYTTKGILDLEAGTNRKILRIERKFSTGELSTNLGKLYKQFDAEMKKMSEYDYSYLILEFSADDIFSFPENSGIPKHLWKNIRMNGKIIWAKLKGLEEKYGFQTIFAGCRQSAEDAAIEIFKEIHDGYNI